MSDLSAMSKEEFCARFKKHMLGIVAPRTHFDDGDSIAEYADETAPSYYDEQFKEGSYSPEELAWTDVSYWEDG